MTSGPGKVFGHGAVPVVYRLNFRDAGSYFLARRFDIRDKDLLYVASHPVNELTKFLDHHQPCDEPGAVGGIDRCGVLLYPASLILRSLLTRAST